MLLAPLLNVSQEDLIDAGKQQQQQQHSVATTGNYSVPYPLPCWSEWSFCQQVQQLLLPIAQNLNCNLTEADLPLCQNPLQNPARPKLQRRQWLVLEPYQQVITSYSKFQLVDG
jgi:hypothetical protein